MKTISIGLAAMALCTLAACATPTATPVPSALPTPSAEAARATTTDTFVAAATNTPEPRASSTATVTQPPATFTVEPKPSATLVPTEAPTSTKEPTPEPIQHLDAAHQAIFEAAPDFVGMTKKFGEGKFADMIIYYPLEPKDSVYILENDKLVPALIFPVDGIMITSVENEEIFYRNDVIPNAKRNFESNMHVFRNMLCKTGDPKKDGATLAADPNGCDVNFLGQDHIEQKDIINLKYYRADPIPKFVPDLTQNVLIDYESDKTVTNYYATNLKEGQYVISFQVNGGIAYGMVSTFYNMADSAGMSNAYSLIKDWLYSSSNKPGLGVR